MPFSLKDDSILFPKGQDEDECTIVGKILNYNCRSVGCSSVTNPAIDWDYVCSQYLDKRMVVVDDFLSTEALHTFWRYSVEAPIFTTMRYYLILPCLVFSYLTLSYL
jgi:hypothetical protein